MTVIVAVRKRHLGAIAYDSLATADGLCVADIEKVVEFSFGVAGFAGGVRETQLVASAWRNVSASWGEKEQADTPTHMEKLCRAAYEILRDHQLTPDDNFEALLLTRKRIWVLDEALGYLDGGKIAAIGSGASVALGAAHAIRAWEPTLAPLRIAELAAGTAVKLIASCGGPVRSVVP